VVHLPEHCHVVWSTPCAMLVLGRSRSPVRHPHSQTTQNAIVNQIKMVARGSRSAQQPTMHLHRSCQTIEQKAVYQTIDCSHVTYSYLATCVSWDIKRWMRLCTACTRKLHTQSVELGSTQQQHSVSAIVTLLWPRRRLSPQDVPTRFLPQH
jgi:hypothetical protein